MNYIFKSKVDKVFARLDSVGLANFVKTRREELGLKVREAARLAGISHTYWTNIELGINPTTGQPYSVTIDTLKKISKVLRVPYMQLVRIASDLPPELRPEEGITEEVLSLARELLDVPKDKRDAIRKLLGL